MSPVAQLTASVNSFSYFEPSHLVKALAVVVEDLASNSFGFGELDAIGSACTLIGQVVVDIADSCFALDEACFAGKIAALGESCSAAGRALAFVGRDFDCNQMVDQTMVLFVDDPM